MNLHDNLITPRWPPADGVKQRNQIQ